MDIEKIDSLKKLLRDMSEKEDKILSVYDYLIKKTLNENSDYLIKKGINVESEKIYLKNLFDILSDNIDKALSQLDEKIIPNYVDYADEIDTLFKNKFSEINDILNSDKGE